jgi:hypothetical protein
MRRARRALAVAVVAMAAAISLAACSEPSVGDGDISGDWVVFEEPVVPTPASSVCRLGTVEYVDFDLSVFDTTPGDCTVAHQTETFYVGKLTGKNQRTQRGRPGVQVRVPDV